MQSIKRDVIVILITPPAVDNSRWPSRHTDVVARYAEGKIIFTLIDNLRFRLSVLLFTCITVIRDLSHTLRVDCVDLWSGNNEVCFDDLCDGLHLGPGGNRKVFEGIKDVILKKYPELDPIKNDSRADGKVPLHFPHYSTLGGLSTEESKSMLQNWQWK